MNRPYGSQQDYTQIAGDSLSFLRDVFSYSSDPRKVLAELEGKYAAAVARGDVTEATALKKQIAAQQAILREKQASDAEIVFWNRIGQAGAIAGVIAIVSIPIYLFSRILTNPSKRKKRSKR